MRLLIIADDFTGALDTGVQFSSQGAGVRVVIDEIDFAEQTDKSVSVIVVDAETRHLTPKEAYDRVHRIVKHAACEGFTNFYIKTDSALRGNIGAELEASMDAIGIDRIAFVPALPVMNRITRNGIHYIDGVPVANSVFGQDPFEPVKYSSVKEIIALQSKVPTIVHNRLAERSLNSEGIHIYDVETQSDIESIGSELGIASIRLCAGCAGFGNVIAKLLLPSGDMPKMPSMTPKLLVVCGSVNAVTLRQMDEAEKKGFIHIHLTPVQKLEKEWINSGEFAQSIKMWLESAEGGRCILDVNDAGDSNDTVDYAAEHGLTVEFMRNQIAENLAAITKALLDCGLASTLLCTGGDTLLALMKKVGVKMLEPVGELAPGTVLTRFCYNGRSHNIISKSGGFGSPDLMIKIAEYIERRPE